MRQTKFQLLLSEREREVLLSMAHHNGISAAGVLRQLLLNAVQVRGKEIQLSDGSDGDTGVRTAATLPQTSEGVEVRPDNFANGG